MLAVEVAPHRFNQNWEGGLAAQATRFPHREEALDPAIAFVIIGALHHLAPEHPRTDRPVELSEGIAPPAGLQNRACHVRGTRLLS